MRRTKQKALLANLNENGWMFLLRFGSCWIRGKRLSEVFLIVLLLSASFSFEAVYAQEEPPVYTFSECKSVAAASTLETMTIHTFRLARHHIQPRY